ncbi:MAG: indole-3-glycerol phosphate synthase TrpC [Simkaniaceae bacterium]
MNFLDKIVEEKKRNLRQNFFFTKNAPEKKPAMTFKEALRKEGPSIIAEFKRQSPSKGSICISAKPKTYANIYEISGADAISVLTEESFFKGQKEDLQTISAHTALPTLRKDFIIDFRQIDEAKALGASAVLLIASVLKKDLKKFIDYARNIGLDPLVEIHNEEELDMALEGKAEILGINNRNLTTFEVDLSVSLQLSKKIPDKIIKVAESGIQSPEDAALMFEAGFDAILIGEALMKAESPAEMIQCIKKSFPGAI